MTDLAEELRAYVDALVDGVGEHDLPVGVDRRPRRRPSTALAASAVAAAVLLVVVVALGVGDGSDQSSVVTSEGGEEPVRPPPEPEPEPVDDRPSIEGRTLDGRPWRVVDDPQHRLCTTVGDVDYGCDDEGPVVPADADPATPRWVLDHDYDWVGPPDDGLLLVHAYLPPSAVEVVALHDDGRRTSEGLVLDEQAGMWGLPIEPGDRPDHIAYLDADGAEVARFPRNWDGP